MLDPIAPPPPFRPLACPPPTSLLATLSLGFGISAWVILPFIGALAAVILGHMARSEMRQNPPHFHPRGDGLAVGGLVLGYAQLALVLLGVAFVMLVFAGIIGLGLSGHH